MGLMIVSTRAFEIFFGVHLLDQHLFGPNSKAPDSDVKICDYIVDHLCLLLKYALVKHGIQYTFNKSECDRWKKTKM